MTPEDWYLGVVIAAPEVDPILASLADLDGAGVSVQRPSSGHLTLLYTPPRPPATAAALAHAVAEVAAAAMPFSLTLDGCGCFRSATRIVHWLDAAHGRGRLHRLRDALVAVEHDVHRHAFVPHCTLLYAEPEADVALSDRVEAIADEPVTLEITALHVAGFPCSGNPAHDLVLLERLPFS